MSEHDPKCLAYGYGPGQRMDICICTGIRIGRADERERLRAQVATLPVPGFLDASLLLHDSWRRWRGKMLALLTKDEVARNGGNDD